MIVIEIIRLMVIMIVIIGVCDVRIRDNYTV
jgi:hypothetical protein